MTEQRDPQLQALFAASRQDLEGEDLTPRVMARIGGFRKRLLGGGILSALVLLTVTWMIFGMPLLEFALLISQVLTVTLVDLGEGWLALIFMPVNNIASLVVVFLKSMQLLRKKVLAGARAM